ncbi:unnamed protein product [Owenia fusiformis]|uniref:Lengsin n=1 Tax=Owenia fusiformis TaxID=6347 RepID=A0A8S4Q3K8_OWEFU|nr:unnamed protein product [Owenia fusiformis]
MMNTLDIGDFDYVRFTTADYHGLPRGKIIPKQHVQAALVNGVQIYCGILGVGLSGEFVSFHPEVTEKKHGNCHLKPDINTLRPIPWADEPNRKIGEITCDLHWDSDFKSPVDAAPREVARRQLKCLDALGYSLKTGWELEFHIFHKDNETPIYKGKTGLYNQSLVTEFGNVMFPIEENLRKVGLDIEALHTEDVDGLFEISTSPKIGLASVDGAYVAKYAIKEIVKKAGYLASFMTAHKMGSTCGLNLNLSILDKLGKNMFYNPEKLNNLSSLAEHWLAGVLSHARAIYVLHSPTVNCFRRVGQSLDPCKANWGIDDRNALIRVKNNGDRGTYMENRMAGGLGNPYLIAAATVAAGIDGIQRKLQLPAENDPNAPNLPCDIEEGIKALREDKIVCDALGEQFVRFFTEMKLATEVTILDPSIPKTNEAYEKERAFYMNLL